MAKNNVSKQSAAVSIDTSDYTRSHGHAPKGRGSWAFCTVDPRRNDYLDHMIWVNETYAVARKSAKQQAAAAGFDTLYVCS